MDLKSKVAKLENKAGDLTKADPKWRQLHAKKLVRIHRMIEKVCGREPEPVEKIISAEVKYLSYWKSEKAYLEEINKPSPEIDEMFEKIRQNGYSD